MFDINTYKNNIKYAILFEQDSVFVVKEDNPNPIGTNYLVSNGLIMYSTSIEPILKLDWLQQELLDYQQECYDSQRFDTELLTIIN